MKILLPAVISALLATSAFAQTARAPIVVLPPVATGASPANFLIDDLEGEDVYGTDGKEIGEIEDFVVNGDGTIAAVVLEVGGFLGIGEKNVLVDWTALQIAVDKTDIRITAPALTREALEAAQSIDVNAMVLGRD